MLVDRDILKYSEYHEELYGYIMYLNIYAKS